MNTDNDSIKLKKKEIRKQIKIENSTKTEKQRQLESSQIINKLIQEPFWKKAKTVLLYSSLPDEPDTNYLLTLNSKRIILPVVQHDTLILREFKSKELLNNKNRFGIDEPTGGEFTNYNEIDLAVIPGIAFDINGNRLGRGKGFYDRFLNKLHCPLIGLCFKFQIKTEIPHEAHDIKLDKIIYSDNII